MIDRSNAQISREEKLRLAGLIRKICSGQKKSNVKLETNKQTIAFSLSNRSIIRRIERY